MKSNKWLHVGALEKQIKMTAALNIRLDLKIQSFDRLIN